MAVLTLHQPAFQLVRYPSRFHYADEPRARDGHRHEYGFKSLHCEAPAARNCARRAPVQLERQDKRAAMMAGLRRQHLDGNLNLDYPAAMPAPQAGAFWWSQ